MIAPLLPPSDARVFAHLAMSLDGWVATRTGASQWISGQADRTHTHRLRAAADAVIVGAGTVIADDPLLTVRHCAGRSPVRVVLDPARQVPAGRRVFGADAATLLITAAAGPDRVGHAEVLRLPAPDGGIACADILAALDARGLRRVFIEGGGVTVSHFLRANLLDRLHVAIAPLLLGAGRPAFDLPGVLTPDSGRRLSWTVHPLGDDVLLDIDLTR